MRDGVCVLGREAGREAGRGPILYDEVQDLTVAATDRSWFSSLDPFETTFPSRFSRSLGALRSARAPPILRTVHGLSELCAGGSERDIYDARLEELSIRIRPFELCHANTMIDITSWSS